MCAFQKVENIFLEIRSGVDLGFVEKSLCSRALNFTSDLPRDPRVLRAVAYKNEQLVRRDVERHRGGILEQRPLQARQSIRRPMLIQNPIQNPPRLPPPWPGAREEVFVDGDGDYFLCAGAGE